MNDSKRIINSKERIDFLDGIKIVACIGVFLTHYVGAFYSMRNGTAELGPVLTAILESPLKLFWDGNLLVFVFAIISGYLCKQKRINTFHEIVIAIITRYLRFFFPLFIANLFVFLIQFTIGFKTQNIAITINNTWLATSYTTDVNLSMVIKESLLLTGKLNGPLWTIRPFMIGSALVYIYSYISARVSKLFCMIVFLFLICINILASGISGGKVILACFAGVFIDEFWHYTCSISQSESKWYDLLICCILCLAAGLQDFLCGFMPQPIQPFMEYSDNYRLIYAALFIAFMYQSKEIKTVFSAVCMTKWVGLSFPIYIFHYPVLCSVSLLVFYEMGLKFSETISFFVTFILTGTLVGLVSGLYEKTVGRAIAVILRTTNSHLLKISCCLSSKREDKT